MNSLRANICEYFIFGFALWTLSSHLTVFIGGSLLTLLWIFGAISFILFCYTWIRKNKLTPAPAISANRLTAKKATQEARVQNTLFLVLVAAAVCLTLAAHRPDADDCRYINRAVAVADSPETPIFEHDTRHSVPGIAIRTASKFIANEMLAGALSLITGLPAITVFHLVFAPLAAILTILAYGELFRILAPKHWAYGVLAAFVFLCADGEVHRTFGNFSFVRLHQGKGVLVAVILPLIIVYSLHFISRPTFRGWLLLAGTQIAAVGMNATGLMTAPLVALLAASTGIMDMRMNAGPAVKRAALSIAASAYIIGLGIYLRLPMARYYVSQYVNSNAAGAVPAASQQDSSYFFSNFTLVFGDGHFAVICLLIVMTAWLWSETRTARCLCLVFPLAVGLVLANPLVDKIVVKYITGVISYWRVFWLLPLPAMAGITLMAPLSSPLLPLKSAKLRCGAFCLLLGLFVAAASQQSIFSKGNKVKMGLPGLKVPPPYQVAKAIDSAVADRPNVLVPEEVSTWLPTMHWHPYPLVSRFQYRYKLGPQRRERIRLKQYIDGQARPENAPAVLRKGIERHRLGAVCFAVSNPWAEEIRQVLREAGFEKLKRLLSHEIWMPQTRIN